MKCQRCHQNEATVHLTQTRQGKTIEYHLCDACAAEMGISQQMSGFFGPLGNLFGSGFPGVSFGGNIFHTTGGIPAFGDPGSQNPVCPYCGQTYEEFRQTGLFGCSHCYEAFSGQLDAVFRRVQGSTHHVADQAEDTGRSDSIEPGMASRLNKLRQDLKTAVHQEAYQEAARIRDDIHQLEKQISQKQAKGEQ